MLCLENLLPNLQFNCKELHKCARAGIETSSDALDVRRQDYIFQQLVGESSLCLPGFKLH